MLKRVWKHCCSKWCQFPYHVSFLTIRKYRAVHNTWHNGDSTKGNILRYTEPFSTILQWLESWERELSNHCKIIENGSVDRKIWSISVLPSGQKFSSRPLFEGKGIGGPRTRQSPSRYELLRTGSSVVFQRQKHRFSNPVTLLYIIATEVAFSCTSSEKLAQPGLTPTLHATLCHTLYVTLCGVMGVGWNSWDRHRLMSWIDPRRS